MSHQAVTRSTPFADLPDWLTIAEAAAYVGCSYWAVHQRIHRAEIPYRREGKFFLIPKSYFDPASAKTKVLEAEVAHA